VWLAIASFAVKHYSLFFPLQNNQTRTETVVQNPHWGNDLAAGKRRDLLKAKLQYMLLLMQYFTAADGQKVYICILYKRKFSAKPYFRKGMTDFLVDQHD
jgi:hypothetical protein